MQDVTNLAFLRVLARRGGPDFFDCLPVPLLRPFASLGFRGFHWGCTGEVRLSLALYRMP